MYRPLESQTNGHSLPHQASYRVAIVRALPGLGDFLCVVPALRALRAALPQAHITLIGLAQTRPLVSRFSHYVDELRPFPGFPGIREVEVVLPELLAFLKEVQGNFDLAIQLHGSGEVSNQFVALMGAKHTAGFYLSGRFCPDPERFRPYSTSEPEVVRNLRLMAFLGIPLKGTHLEFPLWPADEEALAALGETVGLRPAGYICLHAGASEERRCWSPHRFAAVADALAGQGYQIVLTGTETEQTRTAAVREAMRQPAIDLTGRTELGTLAALLSKASLLICNDTGVSHLADALAVPSVVIFQNADARRWAPLDKRLHRPVNAAVEFQWQPDPITEAAVLKQALSLLAREADHVSA
jgi:ADP-heptose:LPS heptosyltransferase